MAQAAALLELLCRLPPLRQRSSAAYLDHELHVLRQCLNAVKAGNETDRYPTLAVHLASQKKVALQVLITEVVVAATIE